MQTYRALDPDKVIETIRVLHQRVSERFPGAGLGGVCAELLTLARENSSRAEKISGRNVPLRVGILVLLAAGAVGLAWIVSLFYRYPLSAENVYTVLQGLEAGANLLGDFLSQAGYTSSLVDIRKSVPTGSFLHLKSGLAYLGDERLVIAEALQNQREFALYDRVCVNAAELYAANCIRVNDHILIARGYPQFEKSLQELGYQTIALEMSEFRKMDGGLSCLSLRF
jgi:hypothetical protein